MSGIGPQRREDTTPGHRRDSTETVRLAHWQHRSPPSSVQVPPEVPQHFLLDAVIPHSRTWTRPTQRFWMSARSFTIGKNFGSIVEPCLFSHPSSCPPLRSPHPHPPGPAHVCLRHMAIAPTPCGYPLWEEHPARSYPCRRTRCVQRTGRPAGSCLLASSLSPRCARPEQRLPSF